MDFYFKEKSHALELVRFIKSKFPIRIDMSKKLVSHDTHSNKYKYKYAWSVELPKICKNDLVILSRRFAKVLGGPSRILLCYKVSNVIHLVDPITTRRIDLPAV